MFILQLFQPHSLFFLFLLFSDLQLLIPDLPEFCKLLLVSLFLSLLPLSLLNLQSPTPLYLCFQLKLLPLLLFKQVICFFFRLGHLLIQNLVLPVFYVPQFLRLSVNNPLPSSLLFIKLLLFLVLLQLLHRIFLPGILLNPHFVFLILNLLLFLDRQQVYVGLIKVCSLLHLLVLPGHLLVPFPFQLSIDLPPNQFSLQLLFLIVPDHPHLVILMLVLDGLRIRHLLLVFCHQLVPHLLVMLLHLLLF